MNQVTLIGAGLAGCEAAWQLASRNIPVRLIDMKPDRQTPAHQLPTLAELVCSNSLRSNRLENAVGLLKQEMRLLGSLIMYCADQTSLPAGGALAVDRVLFSQLVTAMIDHEPLIVRETARVDTLPPEGVVIVATGPLTEGGLFESVRTTLGIETLSFFDAAAPVVTADSINMNLAFRQSRYGRGGDDYLNCPMDQEQYDAFWNELISARTAEIHGFEQHMVFEGCMPIETMARRGRDTIRYGPLKPVGLTDPRTGKEPYACVQLRQDDRAASLYNLVGFQTRLAFPEQTRVFRMIPGLEEAEIVRFGVMHRNTHLNAPRVLDPGYSVRQRSNLFFAGQITGVEGYVESAASGLLAGWQAALRAAGADAAACRAVLPSDRTVIGALAAYVADERVRSFQPMNANFGLVAPPEASIRKKDARIRAIIDRSLAEIEALGQDLPPVAPGRLQFVHKSVGIPMHLADENQL